MSTKESSRQRLLEVALNITNKLLFSESLEKVTTVRYDCALHWRNAGIHGLYVPLRETIYIGALCETTEAMIEYLFHEMTHVYIDNFSCLECLERFSNVGKTGHNLAFQRFRTCTQNKIIVSKSTPGFTVFRGFGNFKENRTSMLAQDMYLEGIDPDNPGYYINKLRKNSNEKYGVPVEELDRSKKPSESHGLVLSISSGQTVHFQVASFPT